VINTYLGGTSEDGSEEEKNLDVVVKEITAGQLSSWPKEGLPSIGKLSVKYAILNRIGYANWVPTNHTYGITAQLAKLIY
jgi:hypothetical protein